MIEYVARELTSNRSRMSFPSGCRMGHSVQPHNRWGIQQSERFRVNFHDSRLWQFDNGVRNSRPGGGMGFVEPLPGSGLANGSAGVPSHSFAETFRVSSNRFAPLSRIAALALGLVSSYGSESRPGGGVVERLLAYSNVMWLVLSPAARPDNRLVPTVLRFAKLHALRLCRSAAKFSQGIALREIADQFRERCGCGLV